MRVDHLPRTSGIYKITCTANGKIYIGSSINIQRRIRQHNTLLFGGRHTSVHMQRTYSKYGDSTFVASVILTCSKQDLLIFEQFYLDTLKPKFNTCRKAGNMLGFRHSQETKNLIGKIHRGTKHTEEAKAKIGAASRGKVTSEETKKKISIANTGKVRTEEVKLQISQRNMGREPPNKGKKASEETRLKLSIAHMGKPSTRRGAKLSDETKQKLSLAKLGKPQPRELVEKRLASYRKTIEKRKAAKEKASLGF